MPPVDSVLYWPRTGGVDAPLDVFMRKKVTVKRRGTDAEARRVTGARAAAVTERERQVGVRERDSEAHAQTLTEREDTVRLHEDVLQARASADDARHEREALLLQMREANERLVVATVRADELAEELRASEAALRKSDRAKDEFLAMLGHELRNPLAPIVTSLDIMELRDGPTGARERERIRRQVAHLTRLVEDLLDVSRIANGKIALRRAAVELAEVVMQAVEMIGPLIDGKDQHLVTCVPPRGLVVDVDITRLTQAVSNLLTNASKYTPAGGTIEVTSQRRDATVTLAIRDNGIGIAPEMLPRVFELFAQAPQTSDRPQGGLGLGLAIVHNLISLHGGRVTAHSDGLGHGSEFSIELPLVAQASLAPAASPRGRVDGTGRRVLVVDDNPDILQVLADLLGMLGHEVRVALDGPAALAAIVQFIPEVVLLDIGLPGMDGYTLATKLRERLGGQVRLIAVSGYAQEPDLARSRDAAFSAHLVKPVDSAQLDACVRGAS